MCTRKATEINEDLLLIRFIDFNITKSKYYKVQDLVKILISIEFIIFLLGLKISLLSNNLKEILTRMSKFKYYKDQDFFDI